MTTSAVAEFSSQSTRNTSRYGYRSVRFFKCRGIFPVFQTVNSTKCEIARICRKGTFQIADEKRQPRSWSLFGEYFSRIRLIHFGRCKAINGNTFNGMAFQPPQLKLPRLFRSFRKGIILTIISSSKSINLVFDHPQVAKRSDNIHDKSLYQECSNYHHAYVYSHK
jgi:hypothetical protein